MKTHRKIAQFELSIILSTFIAATPYTMSVSEFAFELAPQTVFAKDGNNGNGGGNGNQGRGESETRGNSQGAKNKGITGKGGAGGLAVRHRDGISEVVRYGRYIMKDSKGRTIVDRRATLADEVRLWFLRH